MQTRVLAYAQDKHYLLDNRARDSRVSMIRNWHSPALNHMILLLITYNISVTKDTFATKHNLIILCLAIKGKDYNIKCTVLYKIIKK